MSPVILDPVVLETLVTMPEATNCGYHLEFWQGLKMLVISFFWPSTVRPMVALKGEI